MSCCSHSSPWRSLRKQRKISRRSSGSFYHIQNIHCWDLRCLWTNRRTLRCVRSASVLSGAWTTIVSHHTPIDNKQKFINAFIFQFWSRTASTHTKYRQLRTYKWCWTRKMSASIWKFPVMVWKQDVIATHSSRSDRRSMWSLARGISNVSSSRAA